MSGWTILLCILLFVIFLVSLGLVTQCSTSIGPSNADSNLAQAYKITTIIAVVLWIALALVIIAGILFLIYGGEVLESENIISQYQSNGSIWTTLLFIILMILLIIVGVGSSAAAVDISKFAGYKNNQAVLKAFDDCCLSAGLCIGTLLIIIVVFIIRYVYSDTPTPINSTTVPVTAATTSIPVTPVVSAGAGAANIKNAVAAETVVQLQKKI